jgi:hypothetical protein
MPVRRLSVGSLVLASALATLPSSVASARRHRHKAAPTTEGTDAAKPVPEPGLTPPPGPSQPPPPPAPVDSAKDAPAGSDDDAGPEAQPEVVPSVVEAKPVPKPPPVPTRAVDAEVAGAHESTVGFSDRLFVRSPGGEVVVFPGGRVQVDAAAFPRQTPKTGAYVRRARVELTGWLGRIFYFDVSADFAPLPPVTSEPLPPSMLPATDNYVAVAPSGDRFILQAGQFDAPFTLENRTSDAYTMFIERSMVARSVGAPRNKEVGAMVHGLLGDGVLYYSGGVFNGDGPDFRNLDNQPDVIGRVTVAPFAGGESAFRRLQLGGSGWYGRHVLGPAFPAQATPGGVIFVTPQWTTGQPGLAQQTLELREHGTIVAAGAELSLPLGTRFGLRGEFVYKQQKLAETDADPANGPMTPLGTPQLNAMAAYGELWLWLAGDERMLPAPGLQLPARIEGRYRRAFEDGLMLAVRGEFVKEDLINTATALADPTRATTRVVAGTAGVNYWRGSFARISINYVVNMWSGTSETIKTLRAESMLEHELLLRFATSL